MTAVRVLDGWRVFKDNGDVCADAAATFYLAGTTTAQAVFSDRALTTSIGSAVSANSLGWFPDIWTSSDLSLKVAISGSGVTTRTYDYITDATTSASGDSSLAFDNVVPNPSFTEWGGGTSFSNISGSGNGVETADNWHLSQSTAASNAVSRQTASATGARYGLRFGRPAASTSTNQLRLYTTISTEEAYRLRGKTVTFSVYLKKGADYSGGNLSVIVATGTSDGEDGNGIYTSAWAGQANVVSTTQAITTSTVRYSFSATLGSNIGSLGVQLAYTPSGTAGSNDWVQVEDVQVEIGALAGDFSAIPAALEFFRSQSDPAGRSVVRLADPGADRIAFWDDSASAVAWLTASTGLSISTTNLTVDFAGSSAAILSSLITVDGAGSLLDADTLDGVQGSGYVQTSRTLTAGAGLSGGGTLASDRTIALDINGQTEDTAPDPAADFLITYDTSATGFKKVKPSIVAVDQSIVGLVVSVGSATQVTVTATVLSLYDTSGRSLRFASVSETAAITSAGANGLDTGSEASDTWYYVYIIAKADGTIDALLSTSATAPTMPSGYTYRRRVGVIRNDGSSNLYRTVQYANRAYHRIGTNPTAGIQIFGGSSGTPGTPTWTAVDVSAYLPTTVAGVGIFGLQGSGTAATGFAPNNSHGEWTSTTNPPWAQASYNNTIVVEMPLESTSVYWYSSGGTGFYGYIRGWVDNI